MAKMSDVAKKAGVSLSTVSHVVNGTRFVMPETAELVRTAIHEMNYAPNVVARSLASASTKTVGLAISVSTNYYFMDIVSAIEKACASLGLRVLLCDTQNDPALELQVVKELAQRQVDGVIFAPSADPEQQALSYLNQAKLPFVLVDRIVSSQCSGVALDNVGAMEALVDHLVSHGHSRIALVAGEPGFQSTIERTKGYLRAMAKHGLSVDPALIRSGNATSEDARKSARALFELPARPTAIASGNNLATIGIMKAVHDFNIKVPDEMALIGFDDFEWADCFEPRLTVIAQPSQEIGRRAAELLMQRIKHPAMQHEAMRLPWELVLRRSCGCQA